MLEIRKEKSMQPLADRLRPQTLEEVVGQEHIIGEGKLLNKLLENKVVPNMVFFGPPGVGKTTAASIIAKEAGMKYIKLNAVNCGVKEIKEAIASASYDLFNMGNGILLMLDEIQALNRKQQQALLEVIEEGKVTLIASTADNPYFVVYKAILSRSTVVEFKPIKKEDVYKGLEISIDKLKKEYPLKTIRYEDEVLKYIAETCNGDMRSALNKLELTFNMGLYASNSEINLDIESLRAATTKNLNFDNKGEEGYSILSAFHKSLRGSDPDAAIHYLARLIKAEDMQGITRRLLCVASEDVGLAVPQAVTIANACVQSALQLGFPEANLPLAECTIYLAQCPKSNSAANAISRALRDLDTREIGEIPDHLKDAHYSGAAKLGRGVEYKYPHNYTNHYVEQQYLPDALKDVVYYEPGENKNELAYQKYWDLIKN